MKLVTIVCALSVCVIACNYDALSKLNATGDGGPPRDSSSGEGTPLDAGTGDATVHVVQVSRQPAPSGQGLVLSSEAGISCGASCASSFTNGQTITLTAREENGWYFQEWSGPCTGSSLTCTFTVHADTFVSARFSHANYAFVTSESYTIPQLISQGTPLAGSGASAASKLLAGADDLCKTAAIAPGSLLEGQTQTTWRAFISTSTAAAITRFTNARGWIRLDGKPFADRWAALQDSLPIFYPLEIEEHGLQLTPGFPLASNVVVLTGTQQDGSPGDTCTDYTDLSANPAGPYVAMGEYTGGGGFWVFYGTAQCDTIRRYRLYCLQTNNNTAMNFTPAQGRYAFLSRPVVPSAGLAAMDRQCQTDATTQGLPGIYKALVAPSSTTPPASRFTPGGMPWVRVDGVQLAASAADLFNGSKLFASLNVTAAGQHRRDSAWFGASSAMSSGGSTCTDWTSTNGLGTTGFAAATTTQWAGGNGGVTCVADDLSVYCLQQ